ncbi:MAG: KpsF/GutQ family sugar-phosphate isomerase, partial [Planctomycetales bacterium]|nr:KpsF/GutQ family sugar-phosphate isomerase [Planctomycetales bacterium]
MSASSAASRTRTSFELLRFARDVLQHEAQALVGLAGRLDASFVAALRLMEECRGAVVVSGMGKAGLVGQKISATLASTGTPSHFLHPSEAMHGDLGRVRPGDVALVLSQSGETEEVVRLMPALAGLSVATIAVTARRQSALGRDADVVLELGAMEEACPNRLAPSTSTTAMIALGDALALSLSWLRQFGPADFARFHPGGSLGLKLASVDDVMRPLDQCRVADDRHLVRDVFIEATRPGRRTGAILLIDSERRLSGVFTDSDLARLLEHKLDAAIDGPIRDV